MLNSTHKFSKVLILFIFLIITCSINVNHYLDQQHQKQNSQTFKGVTSINISNNDQKQNNLQYYISFLKYSQDCSYKICYYGVVNNYTKNNQQTVYGYPKQQYDIPTIFQLKVNSKKDYVIIRHPKLSDIFTNIIQVGCQLIQPTLKQNIERQQSKSNFNFVPIEQYQKIQPKSDIILNPSKFDIVYAAQINQRLNIQDVQTKQSLLKQQIAIDKQYNIVRRLKYIDINLPTDNFADQKQKPDFISHIKIGLEKVSSQPIDRDELKKILQGFKSDDKNSYFTSRDIQQRRSSINLYKQDIKFIDEISPSSQTILKAQASALSFSRLRPIRYVSPTCTLTNIPSSIEITIFTYEKILFEKTIFGKKFSVSLKITASIINNNNIRFKGTLTYNFFSKIKIIQIFNYIKQINLNWSKSYSINGSYSTSIYIPLPPPVSFIGINFSFTVSFSLYTNLYAKGSSSIVNCIYTFQVGANTSTQVNVGASAAIRVIAIEGGVYIDGVLVNLSTDPKLVIAYNVQNKSVVPKITWYFYIKAFKFQWGFFYRTWGLFSGWSGRKIIAKWPVSNAITQTYLVYKN